MASMVYRAVLISVTLFPFIFVIHYYYLTISQFPLNLVQGTSTLEKANETFQNYERIGYVFQMIIISCLFFIYQRIKRRMFYAIYRKLNIEPSSGGNEKDNKLPTNNYYSLVFESMGLIFISSLLFSVWPYYFPSIGNLGTWCLFLLMMNYIIDK